MPEPTIDDYKRRLDRLLSNELAESGKARAQLSLDGAKHGHFSDNSSGFRLQEDALANARFVAAMEVALTECRRVSDRTTLDPRAVFDATSEAVSLHLDALIALVMPPQNPAFANGGVDTSRRASDAYGRLRELQTEVFWEYDHGLFALPGEQGSPIVINVANVHGSEVRSIQQSGNGSAQRGETGK
jgi:hypothetical protein